MWSRRVCHTCDVLPVRGRSWPSQETLWQGWGLSLFIKASTNMLRQGVLTLDGNFLSRENFKISTWWNYSLSLVFPPHSKDKCWCKFPIKEASIESSSPSLGTIKTKSGLKDWKTIWATASNMWVNVKSICWICFSHGSQKNRDTF